MTTGLTTSVRIGWLLMAIALLVGCPRPSVDLQPESANAGGACASATDCESGLQCVQEACCADDGCVSRCTALFEKDDSALSESTGRYPEHRPFLARKCVQLCCGGAEGAELEAKLEFWAPGP